MTAGGLAMDPAKDLVKDLAKDLAENPAPPAPKVPPPFEVGESTLPGAGLGLFLSKDAAAIPSMLPHGTQEGDAKPVRQAWVRPTPVAFITADPKEIEGAEGYSFEWDETLPKGTPYVVLREGTHTFITKVAYDDKDKPHVVDHRGMLCPLAKPTVHPGTHRIIAKDAFEMYPNDNGFQGEEKPYHPEAHNADFLPIATKQRDGNINLEEGFALVITRHVKPGDEIFVPYGEDYWFGKKAGSRRRVLSTHSNRSHRSYTLATKPFECPACHFVWPPGVIQSRVQNVRQRCRRGQLGPKGCAGVAQKYLPKEVDDAEKGAGEAETKALKRSLVEETTDSRDAKLRKLRADPARLDARKEEELLQELWEREACSSEGGNAAFSPSDADDADDEASSSRASSRASSETPPETSAALDQGDVSEACIDPGIAVFVDAEDSAHLLEILLKGAPGYPMQQNLFAGA